MGSGISEAMGSIDSIKNTMGGGGFLSGSTPDGMGLHFGGDSSLPQGAMSALTPGTMSSAGASGPNKFSQFGKKALKNGLMGGAQGLQQQGQGQQRGGGVMPQYIQGAMLPQIPGQSQQQVMPYGVNNPFFGG